MTAAACQPLARAIEPCKQGARRHYGSHPYFTKRAWNVVQAYINHFSSPGDTVLDPFGGSGVTAAEALVLRRKAVYVDISRWACFLARQTALAPVNLAGLQRAFGQVTRQCREVIQRLWSRPEKELAAEPVSEWYPRRAALPSNADVQWVEELFTPRMLHGLARLRAAIMEVEDMQARALLLMAFSATLARINRTFLSASNRAESRGGSAIFSIYRYKVAKRVVELPLWEQFEKRVERLLDAKRETNQLIGDFYREGDTAVFRQGSATRLSEWLEPGSVDYIYTDPPYGGHIAYLDLSTMWAAWLDMDPTLADRAEEVIEGGQLRKPREVYHRLLSDSIAQMHQVLKTGGWMSLVFAHRDTSYWEALVDACTAVGFEYVNTVVQPVGVVWSMHKKKNPLRVLSGELVLNFRKVRRHSVRRLPRPQGNALDFVRRICEDIIVAGVGATTEELHHALVPRLLECGLLAEFSRQWGDITPLLEEWFHFDRGNGRWFLPTDWVPGSQTNRARVARYLTMLYLTHCAHVGNSPTENQVLRHVSAKLDGRGPIGRSTVRRILKEVAYSPDDRHWQLSHQHGQREFAFSQ
jgi:16S rRNA G966 N2-methylase RsmD